MAPILSRTSIRDFTDLPVSDVTVDALLRAAMAAPSAADERPWHFVVIRDQHIRERILEINRFAHIVPQAPVAILVCGDERLQKHRGFWVQDCAAATENILVEAEKLGLGATWLGVYPIEGMVQGLRRLLNIPEHAIPFALVAVGHPGERHEPADRYDDSRVHEESWRHQVESRKRQP